MIRLATAVDKYRQYAIVSFINGAQCKGISVVFSDSYKRWPRIPSLYNAGLSDYDQTVSLQGAYSD